MSSDVLLVSARLIHASIVKFCSCRLAGFPRDTLSFEPSKLNDWPTNPDVNIALPTSVPWRFPTVAAAFPSPFHHPSRPNGAVTQVGEIDWHLPALLAW